MSRKKTNTQLFALPAPPSDEVCVGGATYKLVRVFKHDFFAATALYERKRGQEPFSPLDSSVSRDNRLEEKKAPDPFFSKIVLKTYRTQGFCGLPMEWLGRFSRDHEKAIYAALEGVAGVPRLVGCVGETGLAIEYIEADPLDHFDKPPTGYFGQMRQIIESVHARGVAYVDANKLSNMLVADDGSPYLIDFQIAVRRCDDWPWPMRSIAARIVRYLQGKDIYHLCKHKRRLAPDELTDDEERLSRHRGLWHHLHRKITKPYRTVRRRFLRRQYQDGRLVSPSAQLEDHHQPEKQTWRAEK